MAAIDVVLPVLPAEATVTAAAVLAGQGTLNIVWVMVAAGLGAFVGDNIAYWIGRAAGRPLVEKVLDTAGQKGTGRWTAGGFAACSAGESQYRPALCSDTAGGAIVCWFDYRNASGPPWNLDIYAQRIGTGGAAGSGGVMSSTRSVKSPVVVPEPSALT